MIGARFVANEQIGVGLYVRGNDPLAGTLQENGGTDSWYSAREGKKPGAALPPGGMDGRFDAFKNGLIVCSSEHEVGLWAEGNCCCRE